VLTFVPVEWERDRKVSVGDEDVEVDCSGVMDGVIDSYSSEEAAQVEVEGPAQVGGNH